MKKILKWIGIILGSFVLVLVAFYTFIYFRTESRFDKLYQVKAEPVTIPSNQEAIVQGRHIAAIKGCGDCHGQDYGGKIVIDDPGLGRIVAPNITNGQGGLTARHGSYTDQDYIRAIKHGIGKEDKTLKLMPSYEYNPLSKKDLGSLVAYLKTLPPVDREMPDMALKPVAYVLTHLDKLPLTVAEKIDHTAKSPEDVRPEVTAAYGKYVAVSCVGCHKDNFKGGDALIPGSPQVPNITASGSIGKWTEVQFINTLRTGITPEGKKLNPEFMPWPVAKEFTDTEIKSLYLFLSKQS